jgi:DHA1 family bicyclomycin/chloramphenicol resistance-like MFS transporter
MTNPGNRADAPGAVTTGFGFVVLLAALSMLLPVSVDVVLPAFPAMAKALHAPEGMVQWTFSSFLLSFGLGQLITGALSDRHGRRPLLLAGLIVFVAASLVCSLATNVIVLVVLRFVEGAGASVGIACARAIVRDVHSDVDRAASLQAYVATVQTVSIMAAPLIGAAVLAIANWRWIFGFLAAAGAVVAAAVALYLPETSPQVSEGILPGYRRVLRLPRTIPLAGFVTFATGSYFVLLAVCPFLLANHINVPLALFGVACCMVVGNVLAGRLVRRFGAQRLAGRGVLLILLACTANCAIELLRPTPAGFVVTMAMFAFSLGMGMPNIFAAALVDAGADAGAASGIMGSLQMVGGAVITWIVTALPWKLATSTGFLVLVCGLTAASSYRWSCVRKGTVQPAARQENATSMPLALAASEHSEAGG